ncbi:MAG: WYL domain-containing protein [Pseudohongiellaceae bacterium]
MAASRQTKSRSCIGTPLNQWPKLVDHYNDKVLKGYKPSSSLSPKVTSGFPDEYLHLLNRNTDLAKTFESLPFGVSNTEVLSAPVRNIEPSIIRAIVNAARQEMRLDVDYVSVNNPNDEGRVIVPHTLVFTGLRWHVRAWCEKNMDYRDFVLSRFRGSPEILTDAGLEPICSPATS